MIRWTLDPIPHGPLHRVRIKADGVLVGNAFLTDEQHNDMAERLADAQVWRERAEQALAAAIAVGQDRDLYLAQWKKTGADLSRALVTIERLKNAKPTAQVPCARCGDPVPAGEATHPYCPPRILAGGLPREIEAGETDGPDFAASSTEQPPPAVPGPPAFVPEQRQGGE